MNPTSERHQQFELTMVPFMDPLYNYAYHLTGDAELANDLLQETYLKAYRFFDRFAQGTNAKAWLYRIMKNTYINDYRRIKRLPELVRYDEQISSYKMLPPPAASDTDPRAFDERNLFDDDIATALSALPEKFKSVVILRDVEDLPYEEIAGVLAIPVGTVRSRLHRARALLFDRLKGYAKKRGYTADEMPVNPGYALAG